MRLANDANANDFTQMYELVKVRYRQQLIGVVAILFSRLIRNIDE
jgi:hypothetical protein